MAVRVTLLLRFDEYLRQGATVCRPRALAIFDYRGLRHNTDT